MAASPSNTPRLVEVVGATGNQGGSVARRQLPSHPRSRLSPATSSRWHHGPLPTLGTEMVPADLFDVYSLKDAFRGARIIIQPYELMRALRPGQSQEQV